MQLNSDLRLEYSDLRKVYASRFLTIFVAGNLIDQQDTDFVSSVSFFIRSDAYKGRVLVNLYLPAIDLSSADLSGAMFWRANLSHADLSKTKSVVTPPYFPEANLSEANLSEAILSRAGLSKADLSKANLSNANLSGADLSKANLSNAVAIADSRCNCLVVIFYNLDTRYHRYSLQHAELLMLRMYPVIHGYMHLCTHLHKVNILCIVMIGID